jgi:hypothetical protein
MNKTEGFQIHTATFDAWITASGENWGFWNQDPTPGS